MIIAMSISILVRGMFGTTLEILLNMYQILYVIFMIYLLKG
jgi:hypothetical protein